MKFYPSPTICRGAKKNLTILSTAFLLNNQPADYDCWGRCLYYKSNKENIEGNWHTTGTEYRYNCDIVESRCSAKGKHINEAVYNSLHTQLVEVKRQLPKYTVEGRQYNVFFITVDSHAYTQNFRNLPQSNEFLVKEMEAITFPYLNRQADRSRENAIAWWFGKTTEKIVRMGIY